MALAFIETVYKNNYEISLEELEDQLYYTPAFENLEEENLEEDDETELEPKEDDEN